VERLIVVPSSILIVNDRTSKFLHTGFRGEDEIFGCDSLTTNKFMPGATRRTGAGMGLEGLNGAVRIARKISLAGLATMSVLALAATTRAQGAYGVINAPAIDMNTSGVDAAVRDDSAAAASSTSDASPARHTALPSAPQAKVIAYQRPTEKVKLVNYLFDAYGPFPIVGSALVAGINQADNTPPEWGGGIGGFGRRWGSNYGIGAITTTTRYGMAELLREDTLYYRCECSGFLPRLRHALISTFTGRRGEDGHRVFSVPSLVAPYVGTMVAVYGWYPGRYDAKDAFRQGNYSLLAYAGGNVVLEFFPSGPHSLLSKMHLQNRHAAPQNSN